MDSSIAVATVSASAVIIAAFFKFAPAKTPPSTNGNRPVSDSTCQARTKAIEEKINSAREITESKIAGLGKEVTQLRGECVKGFDELKKAISEKPKK